MSKASVDLYMNIYRHVDRKGQARFLGGEIHDTIHLAQTNTLERNGELVATIPVYMVIDTYDGEFIKFTEEL